MDNLDLTEEERRAKEEAERLGYRVEFIPDVGLCATKDGVEWRTLDSLFTTESSQP